MPLPQDFRRRRLAGAEPVARQRRIDDLSFAVDARHVEPDVALTRTAPDITPGDSERAARSTEVAR